MRSTSIALSDHWIKFTADLVASGRYGSTSEVVREGLRLVEERHKRMVELSSLLEEGEASGFDQHFDFDDYIAATEDGAVRPDDKAA